MGIGVKGEEASDDGAVLDKSEHTEQLELFRLGLKVCACVNALGKAAGRHHHACMHACMHVVSVCMVACLTDIKKALTKHDLYYS